MEIDPEVQDKLFTILQKAGVTKITSEEQYKEVLISFADIVQDFAVRHDLTSIDMTVIVKKMGKLMSETLKGEL